jgi:phosphatidate cytidylyltransferase
MKRVATALVLVPVLTWLILAGPHWAFVAVLVIVGLVAFYEYDQLAAAHGLTRAGIPGMAAGVALLFAPDPEIAFVLAGMVGLALALRIRDLPHVLPSAASFVLGIVYIFGAWRCALALRDRNPRWLLFALVLSWAGDTAALYIGKAFGRHKLAPNVSPAKTWEGAIGSVAGGILAGAIYAHYLLAGAPLGMVLILAAAGNIAGQLGDLAESALKRGAGVKDSGSSLPGHGGWLDRIDSSLFGVPVVYGLLKFFPW